MEFSLNNCNEDFIINNVHHSLIDDDTSYTQKNHFNFSKDNLGQSSLNGWSPPPSLTRASDQYNQNSIPFIPNKNYNPFNLNLFPTQNLPIHNPPTHEITSEYPFMGTNSYSKTDSNKNYMAYNPPISGNNPPISAKSKGIFDIFHDVQGNPMWYDTIHNKGLITSGSEPALDKSIVKHRLDIPVSEGVKNTTQEIINRRQDPLMIKTDQKKNEKAVKRSNPLKKANIIKKKWTPNEDRKLEEIVEVYGTKRWGLIAKMLKGRVGKQCRERWHNHLRRNIKKGAWSEEEDKILIEVHKVVGNKWTEIALHLSGRSENTIKNHWNATKRQIKTMQSDEITNLLHSNLLKNYIRYVTMNNDSPKAIETAGTTTTINDGDNSDDVFDGEMNLNLGVTTHTAKPLVDTSKTSSYVPVPEPFSWDDYITELCESMDETQMLMQGWD